MTAIRPSMSAEEALVVTAALLYYRDTYLDDPDEERSDDEIAEADRLTYLANKIRIRIHKALRRRGYPVFLDE